MRSLVASGMSLSRKLALWDALSRLVFRLVFAVSGTPEATNLFKERGYERLELGDDIDGVGFACFRPVGVEVRADQAASKTALPV